MNKLNGRLEWAAFAALIICVGIHQVETRILSSFFVFLFFILIYLVRHALKKILISSFEIPLFLVILLTAAELLNLRPILVLPALILLYSSKKFPEQIESAVYFIILMMLPTTLQTLGPLEFAFYPVCFLVTACGFILIRELMLMARKTKS